MVYEGRVCNNVVALFETKTHSTDTKKLGVSQRAAKHLVWHKSRSKYTGIPVRVPRLLGATLRQSLGTGPMSGLSKQQLHSFGRVTSLRFIRPLPPPPSGEMLSV